MSIKKGSKNAILYKGDYAPAKLCKGSKMMAGYTSEEETGERVEFLTEYNKKQPIKEIVGKTNIIVDETYKSGLVTPYDTIKTNQIIPDGIINLTLTTSSATSVNTIGDYISKWLTVENRVGHKVYAKIINSDSRLRVCWYKGYTTSGAYAAGYDFITGQLLDETSSVPLMKEGIYTITQDIVWSDGYAQLYYYKFAGLPSGTHTITLQLTDLTEIYGEGNEPTNLITLKAQHPELKLVNAYGYRLIGGGEWRGNQIQKVKNTYVTTTHKYYAFTKNDTLIYLHKYYIYFYVNSLSIRYSWGIGNPTAQANDQTISISREGAFSKIVTQHYNGYNTCYFHNLYANEGENVIFDIKDYQIVDLTDLYGQGSEPTTVEQFLSDHPEYNNYVEYAPLGTVRNQIVTNDGTIIPLSAPIYKVDDVADTVRTNVGENRKFIKVEYNGTENITIHNTQGDNGVSVRLPIPTQSVNNGKIKCNVLKTIIFAELYNGDDFGVATYAGSGTPGLNVYARFGKGYGTLQAVKNYITSLYEIGNPLTIIYELATPTQTLFPEPYKLTSLTSVTDGFKELTLSEVRDKYVKHLENVQKVEYMADGVVIETIEHLDLKSAGEVRDYIEVSKDKVERHTLTEVQEDENGNPIVVALNVPIVEDITQSELGQKLLNLKTNHDRTHIVTVDNNGQVVVEYAKWEN